MRVFTGGEIDSGVTTPWQTVLAILSTSRAPKLFGSDPRSVLDLYLPRSYQGQFAAHSCNNIKLMCDTFYYEESAVEIAEHPSIPYGLHAICE